MNVDIIKQNPPRQYSILINDSNLREIDQHKSSKRTAFMNQKLVVRETLRFFYRKPT